MLKLVNLDHIVSYDYAVASTAAQTFDWYNKDKTVEGTLSLAVWDCTAYTTWVDGLTSPTELQQAIIDNYSSYALGVLLHYDSIDGVIIDDNVDDGSGNLAEKEAFNGAGICLTEAAIDETTGKAAADEDAVTLCSIMWEPGRTDYYQTSNFDKATWETARADTTELASNAV